MLPKATGKRGRPKRKPSNEEQESNQSFSCKPSKRLKQPSKKQGEKKKGGRLISKPSKSKVELSSLESFSESNNEQENKCIKVPLEVFNANQVFAMILNKANKEPEFLMMLRNLLSGSSRLKEDKVSQYRKKWKMLKNSNCTQNEYFSRQSQLKRTETEEFAEIEEDIFSKLALANIQGFESREAMIAAYKAKQKQEDDQQKQYEIQEHVWNAYRQEQRKLLETLMKENDLVSQDYKLINITHSYSEPQPAKDINKEEQNEMEAKFLNLETEENPVFAEFEFRKHYESIINYDRVFEGPNPFKVTEEEKYYIDSKAMAWLLESKCDEIYTSDQFQRETHQKYSNLLKFVYENPNYFSDKEIIDKFLESAAYVLNSVHYYQKFKLKCELLHPLDLLLVIEKLAKTRSKQQVDSMQSTRMEQQNKKQVQKVQIQQASQMELGEIDHEQGEFNGNSGQG